MKHLFMRLMIASVVALSASSARADDCGSSDRVPLPACASTGRIQGTKPGLFVHNLCKYPITVKFDKPGSDLRLDIPAGTRIDQETPPDDTKLSCCPRYSQCADPPPPPASGRQNLAQGKPASQSSLLNGGAPARAVDGNTDGNWFNSSVTHTDSGAQPWWQVDLGATKDIGEVVLYNRTDCCADRLSNFEIKVSNDGATWTKVAELAGTAPTRSAHPVNATGRYVRVQLRGTNVLSLAEVQVFGKNLALGKPATQSTTYNGGAAARAVDGNTDGNWFANSVTHTDSSAQPWWQVDLGGVQGLKEVVLYNRSDCCADRLTSFEIKVSSDGTTWTRVAELAGTAPARSAHPVNATGRYVRVQLRGTNPLSLAEVQVFGQ